MPPDVHVEEYAGGAPPIQATGSVPPKTPTWSTPATEVEPADKMAGWILVAALASAEVAIAILTAALHQRIPILGAWHLRVLFAVSGAMDDNVAKTLIFMIRLLLFIHEVAVVVSLFWVASHAKRNQSAVSHWLLPIFILQSVGLALYLVGPSRADGK